MYRPTNWENPYHKYILKPSSNIEEVIGQYCHAAFEAGADAMLETLFKMAKESPTGTFVIDSHVVNIFHDEE